MALAKHAHATQFPPRRAAQPAVPRAVETLREQGVRVLLGEGGYKPHPPRKGDPAAFPWERAVAALG